EWLVDRGAALVGIDSHNIDDIRVRARPGHTILLRAAVSIFAHMTKLGALPDDGFAFTAAPPKIEGMGTFPVRAFALLNLTRSLARPGWRPFPEARRPRSV